MRVSDRPAGPTIGYQNGRRNWAEMIAGQFPSQVLERRLIVGQGQHLHVGNRLGVGQRRLGGTHGRATKRAAKICPRAPGPCSRRDGLHHRDFRDRPRAIVVSTALLNFFRDHGGCGTMREHLIGRGMPRNFSARASNRRGRPSRYTALVSSRRASSARCHFRSSNARGPSSPLKALVACRKGRRRGGRDVARVGQQRGPMPFEDFGVLFLPLSAADAVDEVP